MKKIEELIREQQSILESLKAVEENLVKNISEMMELKEFEDRKNSIKAYAKKEVEKALGIDWTVETIKRNQYRVIESNGKKIRVLYKFANFADRGTTKTNWFTVAAVSKDIVDFVILSLETANSEVLNLVMDKKEYEVFLSKHLLTSDGRINFHFFNDGSIVRDSSDNSDFTMYLNRFDKIKNSL